MVKLKVTKTDINQLVDNLCEPFKSMAEKGHYQFHIHLLPEPLMLWIDAEKWHPHYVICFPMPLNIPYQKEL